MGTNGQFWDEQEAHSATKAKIVAEYVHAWASVLKHSLRNEDKLRYLDLMSGAGRYRDGSPSTPLLVLEKILRDNGLRCTVQCVFNDADAAVVDALRKEVEALDGISGLRYAPVFMTKRADANEFIDKLCRRNLTNTLVFLDPFGRSGLSRRVISHVLGYFGGECFFFFNVQVFRRHICQDSMRAGLIEFFGEARFELLAEALPSKSSREQEALLVGQLKALMEELGAKFVTEFRLVVNPGHAVYYLVHLTKHERGRQIIERVMRKHSSATAVDPTCFGLVDDKTGQLSLLDMLDAVDSLAADLLEHFDGRRVQVREMIREHKQTHRFVDKDYREALKRLASDFYPDKYVRVEPEDGRRLGPNSLSGDTYVTVLSRSN